MADKANPGKKASAKGRAEVVRCYAVGTGGSVLACSTFLLSLEESTLLCSFGSFDDGMAPGGSVRGEALPGLSANVEVFQGDR